MTPIKRPSLLINALSNWTAMVVNVLIGFLLTRFLWDDDAGLGNFGYGIWATLSALVGCYGILDLGVKSAISRYVARYAAQKDYDALNRVVSTALAMFCTVGTVVALLSPFIAWPLAGFFDIPGDYLDPFAYLVCFLGIATAIGLPASLLGGVVRAHERFAVANIVTIIISLLRTGLTVLFIRSGWDLAGIAGAYAVASGVELVLNHILCRRLFSYYRPALSLVSRATLKILLAYGASTVILEVANIMRFQVDQIVIAKWAKPESLFGSPTLTSLEMVTVYSIAALIIKHYLNFVVRGTQSVFTPRFSSIDGTGDREELRRIFLKSLRIAAFLTCCGGTLVLFLGHPFAYCWAGDRVAGWQGAVAPLSILAMAYIVALSQNPGIALVFALKKHHFLAAASMVEGVANLALSIYLAPRYGIVGVAWGTAIPMLVIKVIVQPIYVTRLIGVSLLSYWSRILPPMALVGAVMALVDGAPGFTFSDNTIVALLGMCVTAAPCVALFAALYMIVTKLTRRSASGKKPAA